MLQIDFCKQRYIILNAGISGQDRIYPKTRLCRTFLPSIGQGHPRVIMLTKYDWPGSPVLLTKDHGNQSTGIKEEDF